MWHAILCYFNFPSKWMFFKAKEKIPWQLPIWKEKTQAGRGCFMLSPLSTFSTNDSLPDAYSSTWGGVMMGEGFPFQPFAFKAVRYGLWDVLGRNLEELDCVTYYVLPVLLCAPAMWNWHPDLPGTMCADFIGRRNEICWLTISWHSCHHWVVISSRCE